MISDGAGACLLSEYPNKNKHSLKIEWIESVSYANELKTCMYQGAERDMDGNLKSWKLLDTEEWLSKSIFSVQQDTRYLGKHGIRKAVEQIVQSLHKHQITSSEIDYLLPHVSSMYFFDQLKKKGVSLLRNTT